MSIRDVCPLNQALNNGLEKGRGLGVDSDATELTSNHLVGEEAPRRGPRNWPVQFYYRDIILY